MADIIDMPGIKIFEGSDQERVQQFLLEVNKLCDRFDCALLPEIRHIGTNTIPNIVAVAKPRLPAEGKADPGMN